MKKINICNVDIKYNKNKVTIIDSYKIKDEVFMYSILYLFLMKTNYRYKRSVASWVTELKAHNKLYEKGLFLIHTKDCDLCDNESIFRKIIYKILEVFQ